MTAPDPAYTALALQSLCETVNACADRDSARARMLASIARIRAEIAGSIAFIGPDVRLVVLPEYALTGFPMRESAQAWRDKAAIDSDGPEFEAMAAIAAEFNIHLAWNGYETDPHFPSLYFQACVVIDPSGTQVLRYRRLISMYAPSPYDVLDPYLDAYGEAALFPVADTALGRLAAIASEEILHPEIARLHAVRGAEVFVHASSEVASPQATPKNIAKQARAIENLAYVVSANTGGMTGTPIPQASADRGSKIVDPRGLIVAEAASGPSMCAYGEVDVGQVRRLRRKVSMGNLLARQPMDLWARAYGGASVHPEGSLMEKGEVITPAKDFYRERQAQVIEALSRRGVI
ncbi:nitrilase [Alkalicaulis satelles]|uniref:Nitrilase n=1 Tax=Alkalicaulis satelles TaxID=2609175 RepID=A0A5M6ZMJ9_9PROT|nr:nitrilase-related carbon-nitrogen hydrolase [Alkalicaulis satelles]KAA5803511.1 nitrilase [Alkalicaulis satelles]